MGFEMNIKRIRYAVAHPLFVMICVGALSMSACTTVPKQDGYSNMFVLIDKETGSPISDFAYKMVTGDGKVYRGITNEQGETVRVTGDKPTELELYADDGAE